jgi:putative aldouronate transport system permease protein
MIFLRDRIKYPISLILREILIANSADTMMAGGDAGAMGDHENIADTIKFATTMVATAPILLLYPFLQRYFVKGAMIGSVKG